MLFRSTFFSQSSTNLAHSQWRWSPRSSWDRLELAGSPPLARSPTLPPTTRRAPRRSSGPATSKSTPRPTCVHTSPSLSRTKADCCCASEKRRSHAAVQWNGWTLTQAVGSGFARPSHRIDLSTLVLLPFVTYYRTSNSTLMHGCLYHFGSALSFRVIRIYFARSSLRSC